MPFQNMSGDADQEYFADGISEDVITALSKLRWRPMVRALDRHELLSANALFT